VLEDFKQTIGDINPSSINIDADFIGTDGMQTLDQVRDIIGYLRTSYFALIGICVLLILMIVLILREMKGTFRCAGIIFTIVGVLTTIVSLVIKNLAPNFIPENDLPAAVQTWIPQVIGDLLTPWTIYGIILLVAGVILLGLSLLVRRNRQEAESPVSQ